MRGRRGRGEEAATLLDGARARAAFLDARRRLQAARVQHVFFVFLFSPSWLEARSTAGGRSRLGARRHASRCWRAAAAGLDWTGASDQRGDSETCCASRPQQRVIQGGGLFSAGGRVGRWRARSSSRAANS